MEDCKELSGERKPLPRNREIKSVRQGRNQTRTEAKASKKVKKRLAEHKNTDKNGFVQPAYF